MTWTRIIAKAAGALARIYEKGILHNDLKLNNIVLDNRDGVYNPVIIDFGKSVPMSAARGPKSFSAECQMKYGTEFPHWLEAKKGAAIERKGEVKDLVDHAEGRNQKIKPP